MIFLTLYNLKTIHVGIIDPFKTITAKVIIKNSVHLKMCYSFKFEFDTNYDLNVKFFIR